MASQRRKLSPAHSRVLLCVGGGVGGEISGPRAMPRMGKSLKSKSARCRCVTIRKQASAVYRGSSLARNCLLLGTSSRVLPKPPTINLKAGCRQSRRYCIRQYDSPPDRTVCQTTPEWFGLQNDRTRSRCGSQNFTIHTGRARKVDMWLPGKGNSNSDGARPLY